ncbi:MAG: serine hydrolase [Chloroflexi bacterium]|nr:serine hydrolase [Chloroflexota bacterium]
MLSDLEHNLQRIADGVRAEWGIYVKFLASGDEIALNADTPMDTMSVIKVPLLVELFRRWDVGQVDLDQRITLQTGHKRFGTGVLRTLDDGLSLTLRDAAMLMIIQSDNTATDLCFDAVGGPDAVNAGMRALGLTSITAVGTCFDWFRALGAEMDASYAELSPEALFRKGYPALPPQEAAAARERFHFDGRHPFGLSSAREMGRLIEMIVNGECVGNADRAACDEMLRILGLQQFTSRIPKYLFGAVTPHKTGDFGPFIANDVGLIQPYGRPPVVLCFFNRRHRGIWAHLEDAVARMSEKVWEYAVSVAR